MTCTTLLNWVTLRILDSVEMGNSMVTSSGLGSSSPRSQGTQPNEWDPVYRLSRMVFCFVIAPLPLTVHHDSCEGNHATEAADVVGLMGGS